jgi:copper chaperone NosL
MKNLYCFLMLMLMGACQNNTPSNPQTTHNMAETTEKPDCHYCGMPTADFENWNTKIKTSQKEFIFCSPRCMLLTIKDPKHTPQNVQKIEAKDYYETQIIDAQKSFFVIGSDVSGPMGKDFVPLKNEESAKAFMKEHQGTEILSFKQIDLKKIKEALGK